MKYTLTLLLIFVSNLVFSQYFTREYTYNASDNDSKIDARKYALAEVKKLLVEELGVYVLSTSNVKTKDQNKINSISYEENIETISECITRTKILEEKWDGYKYYIKVMMYVDRKDLERRLKKISKNSNNGQKSSTTTNNPQKTNVTKEKSDKQKIYFDIGIGTTINNTTYYYDTISTSGNNNTLNLYVNAEIPYKYGSLYTGSGLIIDINPHSNKTYYRIPVKVGLMIYPIKSLYAYGYMGVYFGDNVDGAYIFNNYYGVGITYGIGIGVKIAKKLNISSGYVVQNNTNGNYVKNMNGIEIKISVTF